MKFSLDLFKKAFIKWNKDKVPMWSAAVSYYAVFSAAPLLLIAVSIAGFFFGTTSVKHEIISQVLLYFGPQTAGVVQGLIEQTAIKSNNIIATTIGFVVLFIGSSGVFGQLKDALNIIFDAEDKTQKGIWHVITDKSSTFALVLIVGFLLLVFLFISTAISLIIVYFQKSLPFSSFFATLANNLISIIIISLLFSLIYIILPDKKVKWNNAWPSAVFVSIMFTLGKEVISFYISHFSGASAYGAAGSLVIILLWIFYSMQIFLYGAELIACLQQKK